MQVLSSDNDVILLLTKSLSEYFLEKISKYILMSDVKFTHYDDTTVLWGLRSRILENH